MKNNTGILLGCYECQNNMELVNMTIKKCDCHEPFSLYIKFRCDICKKENEVVLFNGSSYNIKEAEELGIKNANRVFDLPIESLFIEEEKETLH